MKKLYPIFLILLFFTNKLIPGQEPEEYSESNAQYLFDSTEIFLNPDASGREVNHTLIKILTPTGAKKFSEASFSYITLYDTVILRKAIVIKPDGKVKKVKREDIEDLPMPAWPGSKFLVPNLRILKVTFPEVEPGCAIEYQVERITRNPPFDSVFDYWELFESLEPIKTKVLKIHFPKNLQPRWVVKNGSIEHQVKEVKGKMVYTFFRSNCPRIIEEPAMPPLEDIATKLVLSTANSWEEISCWYYQLCEPKLLPDSEIKEGLKNLLRNAQTKDDTLRSLFEFTKRQIRYVETKLTGKKGGYEPAAISFTYKNRYGVCRDKAALLVGLLREAGFKNSYMVLTNPNNRVEKEIPAVSQFNHAIVALKEGENFIFFDPTVEWSVEFLSPIEDDREVLICTPEGQDLTKTPERPGSVNLTKVKSNLNLLPDRTGKIFLQIVGKGAIDMVLRNLIKMLPKERLSEIFLQSFKLRYPQTIFDSIKTSDPEDYRTPITLELFLTVPEYATKIGQEWHIGGGGVSSLQFLGGNPFATEERRYPIYFNLKNLSEATSTITFPKNLKVKFLPTNYEKKIEDMEVKIETKVKKDTIFSFTRSAITSRLIPPERYQENKKLMEEIETISQKRIILEEK